MKGEILYTTTDYFRPFPNLHDVFADHVEEHAEYLLPAGTLSLSHISSEWSGEIHFLLPIEPVPGFGVPFEKSIPYHNYLCRPNWFGYHLRENKAQLAADFRIFHKAFYAENLPDDRIAKMEFDELPQHYAETREQFKKCAAHFRTHGWLCNLPDRWNPTDKKDFYHRYSLVNNLGGVSHDGNWSNMLNFPLSRYPNVGDNEGDCCLPQTEDGRDFAYIGEIEMWNYIGDTNGILLLFYDPVQQIALSTIDWT